MNADCNYCGESASTYIMHGELEGKERLPVYYHRSCWKVFMKRCRRWRRILAWN